MTEQIAIAMLIAQAIIVGMLVRLTWERRGFELADLTPEQPVRIGGIEWTLQGTEVRSDPGGATDMAIHLVIPSAEVTVMEIPDPDPNPRQARARGARPKAPHIQRRRTIKPGGNGHGGD